MEIQLSDYDHENERHVEIWVWPDLSFQIARRIETNTDYLGDGDPPDDWEEECRIQFANAADIVAFTNELVSDLLQACFCYWDDSGNQVDDSDDVRALVAKGLEAQTFSSPRGEADKILQRAKIDELLSFPR